MYTTVEEWVRKPAEHFDEGSGQNQKEAALLAATMGNFYSYSFGDRDTNKMVQLEEAMARLRDDQVEAAGSRVMLSALRFKPGLRQRGLFWVWEQLFPCFESRMYMNALLDLFEIAAESHKDKHPEKVPE